MKRLDEQEKLIARELVRHPRESDNRIAERTGVNARTVSRKRHRLEEEGILSYHTQIDLSIDGAGQYPSRHLYVVKFRIGFSYQRLVDEIQAEPAVRNVFGELIYESQIAEIDGRLALLLYVEGENDRQLVQAVQDKLIPNMLSNHGADAIEEISSIRILRPVRTLRNYLPFINMKGAFMRDDWPDEAIYVGR